MSNIISENDLVACICEGTCEKVIIEILMEEEELIFNEANLLDDNILLGHYRNPKNFTGKYLTVDYEDQKLFLFVIKDDKKSAYNIDKTYEDKIFEKKLIVTSPEIEMLMIISLNLYDDFQKVKSKTKPSEFLKGHCGESVKNEKFIRDFYKNHSLVDSIKLYNQKAKKSSRYETMMSLLR